ncbi:hypothetical protein ABH897_002221 [Paenibacillus sp. RC73]|uniref:hypothetical protein n=1 Tax=Paenibacillus sp. RC73 TaxID=3156250 RepID=UPI003832B2D4
MPIIPFIAKSTTGRFMSGQPVKTLARPAQPHGALIRRSGTTRAAPSDTPFLPPPHKVEVKNCDSTAESSEAGRIVLKKRQRLPLSPDFNL